LWNLNNTQISNRINSSIDSIYFLNKNSKLLNHKKKYFQNNENISIKLNFCAPYFWKKTYLFKQNMVFKIGDKKIFNRSSRIPFSFRKLRVKIYCGKKWTLRQINLWNIGFKFGELTWNRRLAVYKAKQLRKKKKK